MASPKSIVFNLEKKRYEIRFPYNPELVEKVKAIPGRVWNPENLQLDKFWTVPPTPAGISALREFAIANGFGTEGIDGSQAHASKAYQEVIDLSNAGSIDQEFVVPGLVGNLLPYQKAGVWFINQVVKRNRGVLLGDEMGLGKQQPIDALVATPMGWKVIGEIRPGDFVLGSSGEKTKVLKVFPQGVKPSYRVWFSDGSSVEAGDDHLWTVMYRRGGRRLTKIVLTTKQLRLRPVLSQTIGRRTFRLDLSKTALYIPMLSGPARFSEGRNLPIRPYTLGAMLSNGSLSHGTPKIVTGIDDGNHVSGRIADEGEKTGAHRNYGNTAHFSILNATERVRALGLDVLSGEKFIPPPYRLASPQDRLALLHGLMDGDGSIAPSRNKVSYSSCSAKLAADVAELVESLGGIASVRHYKRSDGKPDEYRVRIRLPKDVLPFSLPRKLSRYAPGRNAFPCRSVVSVEYVRNVESVCLAVEAEDKLYCTEHYILTHNSLQALSALFMAQAFPAIIGCPKSMKLVWASEIKKFFGEQDVLVVDGRAELPSYDGKIVIVNYEVLDVETNPYPKSQFDKYLPVGHTEHLKALKPQAVIFDEAHLLKNYKSKRGIAAKLLRQRVPVRMALTGTPVLNRTGELLNILSIIGQIDAVGGFDMFKARYVDELPWLNPKMREARILELHNQMRSTFYIRREKKDVLKELPPVRFTSVPMELGSRKGYNRALERLREARHKRLGLEDLAELRQAAWKAKLNSAVDWIADLVSQDQKVIVFAEHIEAQNALIKDIGKKIDGVVLSIRGQDTSEQRQEAVAEFQTGKYPVIVCSLRAAGVGITLTAASNVVFFEYPWTPGDLDQAWARAHRIGQEQAVNVWYLVGQGTVDEYWITLLDEKRKVVEAVTSGRAFEEVSASIVGDLLKYLLSQSKETIIHDENEE